jgi:sugar phosphate isomerase/epimerase
MHSARNEKERLPMYLALNTFVYEVAKDPVEEALRSAGEFGFRFIEYAAYQSGDPTLMDKDRRNKLIAILKDNGLQSSQMLLLNTQHIASPDPEKRKETLDYMKRCAHFQLELGGRQVLICRGCGIHEPTMMREQAWVNMVSSLREYAAWGLDQGILIDLEVEPHVYFVVNSVAKMAQAIEDIGMPNVVANVDIGHLAILREGPNRLEKVKNRILHVHISETDTFKHTNSIIGTGVADFRAYIDKMLELGIEENCQRYGEPCVAGIEMGARGGTVDDADRWVRESLDYLARILPELKR